MFDELLVSGPTADMAHTRKPWSVGLAVIIQSAILGTILLIPLIYTQTLPHAMINTFLVAPPPPAPPPPPQQAVVKQVQPKTFAVNRMVAPTMIPKQVEIAKDEAPPSVAASDTAGVAGGTGDVLGGIGTGVAPPPPPSAATPDRIKVGGEVQSASLVKQITPEYPGYSQVGPRFGYGDSARHHLEGRLDRETRVRVRAAAADGVGDSRSEENGGTVRRC